MLKTGSIKLTENSSLLLDIAKDVKISNGDDDNDKMIKKSSFYKKSIIRDIGYLICNIKAAVMQLRKVFTRVSIFWHFDLEYYTWIKINVFAHTIGRVLS